ncbi:MAG: phosphoheptose isomerase [Deltaproteobacteria bacterium]|nr:D-sedoheptulose 7-phosphate isomerase [Deltaproteobacteria bacterium]MBW2078576.1 D-sedoheptulose 7-phosphate isomerase [Deltaproteobacteria bacterium]MBW2310582.1 D-sedoheptulose 7-phosphate isomerase [Deltaproteobacteria bacterium]RLB31160.1 MAG: phosphoheptose isomerase [Deltaproteobacteria bacterium]
MGSGIDTIIEDALRQSLSLKEAFVRQNADTLIGLAERISKAFLGGGKLMLCGNGGSAADAQHIAAEFVNRFQKEREPLPALALTTDTSIITSIANDEGYEHVFSKQVTALGEKGDILIAISTSGTSANIISAIQAARESGIYTVGLTGCGGGKMLGLVDLALIAESTSTPRIQEVHIFAGHLVCELVEYTMIQGDRSP